MAGCAPGRLNRHAAALAILICVGCGTRTADLDEPVGAESPAQQQTFSLRIDFGDGRVTKVDAIKWKPGTTAIDALRAAEAQGVSFRHRGKDATAFVESIGGLDNSAGGKNWLFYVNGKKADRGAGAWMVRPQNVVLWKYTDDQ